MSGRLALAVLVAALLVSACGAATAPAGDAPAAPTRAAAATAAGPTVTVDASRQSDAPAEPALTPTAPAEPQPVLRRLTEPGCTRCATPVAQHVQPVWSPDGRRVLFVDRPGATDPPGLYGVSVEGGPLELVSERLGTRSPDGRYVAYLDEAAQTVVEDTTTGEVWPIPSDRHEPLFSPGGARLAWDQTVQSGAFSQRPTSVSVSNVDGTDAREVATVVGGGIAGWLDDNRLLLQGRPDTGAGLAPEQLFSLDLATGETVTLAESDRLRGAMVAPGGEWVFYTITFDPNDASQNGQWVVRADGSERHKLEMVGAAQWRDGSRLLIIPQELGAPSHRLVQFEAETGHYTDLTDPGQTPFRVLAADWRVSPTGEHIVFVSAEDGALWVLELPPGG